MLASCCFENAAFSPAKINDVFGVCVKVSESSSEVSEAFHGPSGLLAESPHLEKPEQEQ